MTPFFRSAVLSAALIVSLTAAGPAMARIAPLQVDFEPFPKPAGSVTTQASDLSATIAELVDKYPERLTGVQVTGPNSVTLTAQEGADISAIEESIARERLQVARGLPPASVQIRRVDRSYAAMQTVRRSLVELVLGGAFGRQVVGIGSDPSRGVAVVYATDDSTATRTSIKKQFGDGVVFRRMAVPRAAATERYFDPDPHRGGAGIHMWNNPHTGRRGHCSSGFPVTLAGVRYQLTAAHCLPGQTGHPNAWAMGYTSATPIPSNDYYFGRLHTTTMSGTFDQVRNGTQGGYGDWALMGGSTYTPIVYTCPIDTTGNCSELRVGGASWVDPALNAGVCFSGATSGQICRQHVVDPEWTGFIGYNGGDLAVGNLTITQADTGCEAIGFGDSGGAVYQGIGNGKIRALGVITAVGGCQSFYTQLQGLRAWNSSITIPTL